MGEEEARAAHLRGQAVPETRHELCRVREGAPSDGKSGRTPHHATPPAHMPTRPQLRRELRTLTRTHRCVPWPTFVVPLLANVPLFLTVSLAIRAALLPSTSLIGSEVLPWWSPPADLAARFEASAQTLAQRGFEGDTLAKLTQIQGPTLAEVDKTMLAPISLGVLTMMNVELGQWLRRGMLTEAQADDKAKQASAAQKTHDNSGARAPVATRDIAALRATVLGNTLRAASIIFVVISSQAPAALVIYWLSSASYTLAQNAILATFERRRRIA